jgi:hypothetical protein
LRLVPWWDIIEGSVRQTAATEEDVTEVWTTEEVAAYCGIKPESVRKTMARWGIRPHDRATGLGGAYRYPAESVKAKKAAAPGKGNREPRKSTA